MPTFRNDTGEIQFFGKLVVAAGGTVTANVSPGEGWNQTDASPAYVSKPYRGRSGKYEHVTILFQNESKSVLGVPSEITKHQFSVVVTDADGNPSNPDSDVTFSLEAKIGAGWEEQTDVTIASTINTKIYTLEGRYTDFRYTFSGLGGSEYGRVRWNEISRQ